MLKPSDCAVLVPVGNQPEPACEASLRRLVDFGYNVSQLRGGSQIDLLRSGFASLAIQAGFKETLWIDGDIDFTPEDVERLRSHNLPIVAGLYVKKDKSGFAVRYLDDTKQLEVGVNGGLMEVRYVAMGFTLVKAEVYNAIEKQFLMPKCGGFYDPTKPIVPYFIPMIVPDGVGGFCYLSEDYSICHRANDCGFKVMVDTTIRLGHIGKETLTWDHLAMKKYNGLKLAVSQKQIADL